MADLRGVYDVNDEPSMGFEVLPEGTYTVKITAVDWKKTKKEDGQYLQITMEVLDGAHQGSVIIDRLNLKNKSDMAVKIAKGQFAALRHAVGVLDPKDSFELVGPRFQIFLKCEKRSDDPTKMSNVVQRYIPKAQQSTAPQQQQGDAPWSNNAPKNEPPAAADCPF